METLKESIQHEACLFKPKSIENVFSVARKVENKKIWLLEEWSLTIESTMLPLLT
jgi:hypothetical protein